MDAKLKSQLVDQYLSRARGELTTALAFGHIIDDLNQQAGCADLVRMAQSAQRDELRHAEICRNLAQDHAETSLTPVTPRGTRPYVFAGASDADQRVLRTVFGCCFGETIAVQWLTDARKLCRDEVARQENHEHLADEVKHSRLGWTYVGSGLLGRREKSLIRSYIPFMARRSLELWTRPESPTPVGLEHFGCPSEDATRTSARKALDEIVLPGLEMCGCA